MKRKCVKQGTNALTVSLPAKWVQLHGLKPGDEIEMIEEGKKLCILTEVEEKRPKSIVLNIRNMNKMLVNRHLNEFYRLGAEEIILNYENPKILDCKKKKHLEFPKYIKWVVQRYIGMEIVSQTKNRIILQSLISKEECKKLDVLLSRIYFLINETFQEFIQAMEGDFLLFESKVYDMHDNIVKFINYYLRLLNFSDQADELKVRLFGIMIVIDKLVDKIRHCAEAVVNVKNPSDKIKNFLSDIFALIIGQFDMILKKKITIEEVNKLIEWRYKIIHQIKKEKFTNEEMTIVQECNIFLHSIVDFVETYVATHIKNYLNEQPSTILLDHQ